MERWDHETCRAFEALGFGSVAIMLILAGAAVLFCAIELGIV